VRFKPKVGKRFKNYFPEEIKGFGFIHNSVDYTFHAFELQFKSMFPAGRTVYRFLHQVNKGPVNIYQDITSRVNESIEPSRQNMTKTEVFYTNYLFSKNEGLQEVQKSTQFKNVIELLKHYGVEDEFIESYNRNLEFKNIRYILHQYNVWLAEKKKMLL
jgi:hypothetical protein